MVSRATEATRTLTLKPFSILSRARKGGPDAEKRFMLKAGAG